jgi:transmembrane sensor
MPPKPDRDAGEFDVIEMTAADWLARREFGLSPTEQADLSAWLRANPRHARIFDELQKTSHILDRWPETLPAPDVPFASASAATVLVKKRSHRLTACGLAAAAAIAIGVLFVWRDLSPGDRAYRQVATTEIGGMQSLRLPDGSVVRLNTDSVVEVRYSESERRVHLTRGEASFSVANNQSRPFFVDADGVSVRAVGTAFNVRLRGEAVEVLVTEGRVRVDDTFSGATRLASPPQSIAGNPEDILSAGQRVFVPVTNSAVVALASAMAVAPAQIDQALAWQERRLKFDAVPLSEVVSEFNRYNRHKLVIEDPTLAAQQFGGTFRPEGYETLISLLQQSFNVVADRRENATVIRRRDR